MIRTVLFSTLYPSAARPLHGSFVEARLRQLLSSGEVETRVVAPVPWFPFGHEHFGEYAKFARTPRTEKRHGIQVSHPRYILPPRVGMSIAPLPLALGAHRELTRLMKQGFDFDLIDAHYLYPDGIAAALLGRWLGKPVVVTSRGSDVNVLSRYTVPRRWIRWADRRVVASVFVSAALRDTLATIVGNERNKFVIRNGVDLDAFPLHSRAESRARLGLADADWLLFVGRLTAPKGAFRALDVLRKLPESIRLAFVGDGAGRQALLERSSALGLAERVLVAGARPQSELSAWYSAASVLVLPSDSEGVPNVVLESLACGTPAVASAVGGIPEVMTHEVAGRTVDGLDPERFARAVIEVLDAGHDPERVRDFARRFNWQETTSQQLDVFRKAVAGASS